MAIGGGGRPGEHGIPGRRFQERVLTMWGQKWHHWVWLQGRCMDLTIASPFILQVPKRKKKILAELA